MFIGTGPLPVLVYTPTLACLRLIAGTASLPFIISWSGFLSTVVRPVADPLSGSQGSSAISSLGSSYLHERLVWVRITVNNYLFCVSKRLVPRLPSFFGGNAKESRKQGRG